MIYLQDPDVTIHQGDVLDELRELPSGSVHMCCTSPPFYGLRDYGTGSWEGGEDGCDHVKGLARHDGGRDIVRHTSTGGVSGFKERTLQYPVRCGKCGARRVDQQIGLEATPDEWVNRLVAVFREVRRVLRDDGTLWVEIGDSYAQNGGQQQTEAEWEAEKAKGWFGDERGRYPTRATRSGRAARTAVGGLKQKDLIGAPWLLAFALRADGWYLRSEIIWAKPNPMPESVTDRPTTSHSRVFLLAKQPRYFYDAEALREEAEYGRGVGRNGASGFRSARYTNNRAFDNDIETASGGSVGHSFEGGRNRRTVWTIPTQPYPEAHFATWPQALCRDMILAGTSERGCCGECGTPIHRVEWVNAEDDEGLHHRVTAGPSNGDEAGLRDGTPAGHGGDAGALPGIGRGSSPPEWDQDGQPPGEPGSDAEASARPQGEAAARSSVPTLRRAGSDRASPHTCPSCGSDGPTVPAVVLDVFAGSGTTGLVARQQGRKAVLIELNAEYCGLAACRLQQQSLFA